MWSTKKVKIKKKTKSAPHRRIWWVGWGRGVFWKKIKFTRVQINPKILQGWKPEMTYITEVKNTINPV